jgi:hypothetical protein
MNCYEFKSYIAISGESSLSTSRLTIINPSSGNGRCSVLASSHGARIQTSRSSSVVKITGLGVDRFDDCVRSSRQETIDKMGARNRL